MWESPTLQLLESQECYLGEGLKVYDPFIKKKVVDNQFYDLDEFLDAIDFALIMLNIKKLKKMLH